MNRIVMVVAACLALGCSAEKLAKTQETAELIARCEGAEVLYENAVKEVIDTGICDAAELVSSCPPYLFIEELYISTQREIGCPSEKP